jgi:hypothetical protein
MKPKIPSTGISTASGRVKQAHRINTPTEVINAMKNIAHKILNNFSNIVTPI